MYKDLTKDELRELQWIIFRGWQKALARHPSRYVALGLTRGMIHDLSTLVMDIEVLL